MRNDFSDRFWLDGNKLRLMSPAQTYGANGTTYRTEIETFARITLAYTSNNLLAVAPTHSVAFAYETKPSNEIDSGYVAGSVIKEICRPQKFDRGPRSGQLP